MRFWMLLSALMACATICCAQDSTNTAGKDTQRVRLKDNAQFTWGASLVSPIDMTGQDMSSIGMEVNLGVRLSDVRLLGVGAGMLTPISNSDRFLPIYLVTQVDFTDNPVCFADVRIGMCVNYIDDTHHVGSYGSAGIGLQLASSSRFSSYVSLGYTYMGRSDFEKNSEPLPLKTLHMVTARLGISF